MAQLIQICWDNRIIISHPCSEIKEYHDKPPFEPHFSITTSKDIITSLYKKLQVIFPTFRHMCREKGNLIRYDISYPLNSNELSTHESNEIFSVINNQLQIELDYLNTYKKH